MLGGDILGVRTVGRVLLIGAVSSSLCHLLIYSTCSPNSHTPSTVPPYRRWATQAAARGAVGVVAVLLQENAGVMNGVIPGARFSTARILLINLKTSHLSVPDVVPSSQG